MRISAGLFSALFICVVWIATPASAAPECMIYVPGADKLAAVECGDGQKTPVTAAPPTAPSPPGEQHVAELPEPTDDGLQADEVEVLGKAKALAEKWLRALDKAKADGHFRDRWCQMRANFQLWAQETNKRERARLWDQQVAIDKELGDPAKDLDGVLHQKNADVVLEYQYKWGKPEIRLKNTQIGARLTNARNEALKMSCQCLRDARTHKLVCCESCDQTTLKERFARQASSD